MLWPGICTVSWDIGKDCVDEWHQDFDIKSRSRGLDINGISALTYYFDNSRTRAGLSRK